MSTWAKYLAGLALALPMGAYVAGSLMASASDEPGNREPVRISDQPSAPRTTDDARDPERSKGPVRTPAPPEHDADDDDGGADDDDVDDNGVRVVTPQPTRLDDGDDDGEAGDDDGDDDGDSEDDSEDRDDSRDDDD